MRGKDLITAQPLQIFLGSHSFGKCWIDDIVQGWEVFYIEHFYFCRVDVFNHAETFEVNHSERPDARASPNVLQLYASELLECAVSRKDFNMRAAEASVQGQYRAISAI
jgi:hypothetical protein